MKTPDIRAELREWRAIMELSQARAAKRLGVPLRTLQGWEAGRPPIGLGFLRICMASLAAGDGRVFPPEPERTSHERCLASRP